VKLEQSFDVEAPIERVWAALVDVEHVAPCLPGAAVTGRNEDGSYNGTITIKIGPTTANYAGKLEMQNIDEAARSATMHANGTDKRGQGGASATITSTLHDEGSKTRVDVVTDYHITGRLARFGRGGMIEDISKRMLREFAQRLQDSLTAEPAESSAPEVPPPSSDGSAESEAEAAEAQQPSATGADGDSAAAAEPAVEPPPQPSSRAPEAAEPIQGLSLAGSVLWDRARRSPLPFVFLGLVLAAVLIRRLRR
jgi:carbon monoxide dehydrogenase subunit G